MKYSETKITTRELQAEVARYEVEERERAEEQVIEEQKQICWEQYEEMRKAEAEAEEFKLAVYMLSDDQIPVKEEDIEADIEECLDEISDEEEEKEEDLFALSREKKNPHSYRRRQDRRVKRDLMGKAIAADKELVKRTREDQKSYKPSVRKPVDDEKTHGETRAHRECAKYNHSYKSQAARADS